MAQMEKQLQANEAAAMLETEVTLPSSKVQEPCPPKAISIHDKGTKGRRKAVGQKMGKCERCGYLSSQKVCKACMLLEGLNRNRPRTTIEVGPEDEDSSTTLMRQMGAIEISG